MPFAKRIAAHSSSPVNGPTNPRDFVSLWHHAECTAWLRISWAMILRTSLNGRLSDARRPNEVRVALNVVAQRRKDAPCERVHHCSLGAHNRMFVVASPALLLSRPLNSRSCSDCACSYWPDYGLRRCPARSSRLRRSCVRATALPSWPQPHVGPSLAPPGCLRATCYYLLIPRACCPPPIPSALLHRPEPSSLPSARPLASDVVLLLLPLLLPAPAAAAFPPAVSSALRSLARQRAGQRGYWVGW